MTPINNFPNPASPGLTLAIEANGITLINGENDAWFASDAAAAEAVIASYDPLPYARSEKKAEAAQKRWEVETGGVTINGKRFMTTREAQGTITAALIAAQTGALPPGVKWKTADGEFVPVNAQSVAGLYQAVAAHVQACFAAESALVAAIDAAATWQDVEAIDVEAAFVGIGG